MSVFGGDSWAREVQHRKRRVDDLMLSSSSSSSSSSYKKLSNGKYACLVCPHNPVLDSPLMISMHNKGCRHIAAESKLKQRELSRQCELNKRIALTADFSCNSNSGTSILQIKSSEVCNKPLIEQTRKAILETQCNSLKEPNGRLHCSDARSGITDSILVDPKISTTSNDNSNKKNKEATGAAAQTLADWNGELMKRRQKELKFTAAGWKRDGHGKWFKDENVEFDSDEEDPNDCLD